MLPATLMLMAPILLSPFGNLIQVAASIKRQTMYPYLWSIKSNIRAKASYSGKEVFLRYCGILEKCKGEQKLYVLGCYK